MREIKFRAWAHAHRAMFYPNTDDGWEVINGKLNALPNTTLMQYTGLKSKSGREIYEGDIVRINDEEDDNCCSVDDITNIGWLRGFIDRDRSVEIIGNIYENPELLNPTEKGG